MGIVSDTIHAYVAGDERRGDWWGGGMQQDEERGAL